MKKLEDMTREMLLKRITHSISLAESMARINRKFSEGHPVKGDAYYRGAAKAYELIARFMKDGSSGEPPKKTELDA